MANTNRSAKANRTAQQAPRAQQAPAEPQIPPAAARARQQAPEGERAPQFIAPGELTAAARKKRAAAGDLPFEVSLPKGYVGRFWAGGKNEAKEQYVTYFGIISTEHKIKVESIEDDDSQKEIQKARAGSVEPDGDEE